MSTARVQEFLSSVPCVTRALLFINIGIHAIVFFTSFPINLMAINPVLIIMRSEYYRLISSAFVHGGLMHILMNMSTLLAIGRALEMQYGSIPMLFITLWSLLLTGVTFVGIVWLYSYAAADPGALYTSAVGYSGVLFSYALIEAFHSAETSRSVFGMFNVPTKAYPFILLVLIQVLMPNISWWGHLSGLLVGLLLISRPGTDLFMPSAECMRYLEQSCCCCRPLQSLGGCVPVQDKGLVHPGLECGACGAALWWALSAVAHLVLLLWQLLVAVLQLVGVPPSCAQRVEECCSQAQGAATGLCSQLQASAAACARGVYASVGSMREGGGNSADAPSLGALGSAFHPTTVVRGLSGYQPVRQEEPSAPPADEEAGGGGISKANATELRHPAMHYV